ncbi:MAG: hypothetical protein HY756_01380 [Nitrospirae bacterium]|nr:hypothetical protein [Nitrospirota bacterium]
MDFYKIFKQLDLNNWPNLLVCLSSIILVLSFFNEAKGISNAQLQLLSSGFLFIGLGELKNYRTMHLIKPANAYTGPPLLIEALKRKPTFVGILLDIIGIGFIATGIWDITIRT